MGQPGTTSEPDAVPDGAGTGDRAKVSGAAVGIRHSGVPPLAATRVTRLERERAAPEHDCLGVQLRYADAVPYRDDRATNHPLRPQGKGGGNGSNRGRVPAHDGRRGGCRPGAVHLAARGQDGPAAAADERAQPVAAVVRARRKRGGGPEDLRRPPHSLRAASVWGKSLLGLA
ncbi:MAG: hypothetical protein CL678_00025 [Bdellovibrionaceae bacterium]|nr:hypothetical protein [Pseudobdellovibrionaceae bacterium]